MATVELAAWRELVRTEDALNRKDTHHTRDSTQDMVVKERAGHY